MQVGVRVRLQLAARGGPPQQLPDLVSAAASSWSACGWSLCGAMSAGVSEPMALAVWALMRAGVEQHLQQLQVAALRG